MISVGRTAAVILFLAAVAAAAPFAPGTKFGMVGLDYRISSGRIYSNSVDSAFSNVDPFFRVGVQVTRNLALGADLALLRTFPRHGDLFLNTPVFAFGPAATWFPSEFAGVQPYGTAGAGATYQFDLDLGWRFHAGVGALFGLGPVAVGPEIGWYGDWARIVRTHHIFAASGYSFYFGLRLSDLKL